MSTSMSVAFTDTPNNKVYGKTPAKEPVVDILLLPETGEVIFLFKSDNELLNKGEKKGDKIIHYLGDNIIDEIANAKFDSNEERIAAIRDAFLSKDDDQKEKSSEEGSDLTPWPKDYKKSMLYTECVSLVKKESTMVAKKFLEKVKNKYISRAKKNGLKESSIKCLFQMFDNVIEGEDLFKDCKITVKKEIKHKKEKKILDVKVDRKLKAKMFEICYPKTYKKVKECLDPKNDKLTDQQKKRLLKHSVNLIRSIEFPDVIEKFIASLDYSIVKEWEKTYAFVKGKRDFNKEEDKKHIIELLEKKPFSQDHAHKVVREIKDLWRKGKDDHEFDKKFGLLIANDLFKFENYRTKLKKIVKDEPVPPNVFTAGVDYALLRFTTKAQAKFESNILEGKLAKGSFKSETKAALAEGKANANFYFPNENGHHAMLKVAKRIEKINWEKIPVQDFSDQYPANFFFDCSFVAPHTAHGLIMQFYHLNKYNPCETKLIGLDIIGHTDAVGSNQYNIKLGQRRADAAFAFLSEDYVGLYHLIEKGEWTQDHIEFMQAVVNLNDTLYGSPYVGKPDKRDIEYENVRQNSRLNIDFSNEEEIRRYLLEDLIFPNDNIVGIIENSNLKRFRDFHIYLKTYYPEYRKLSQQSIKKLPLYSFATTSMIMGKNKDYLLSLCYAYQKAITHRYKFIMDNLVQFRYGVISKGEEELLVDTQYRNKENRRVVLKGYKLQAQTTYSSVNVTKLDFGYFRMDLTGSISGFAGANVLLSGDINVGVNTEALLVQGLKKDKKKKSNKPDESKKPIEEKENNRCVEYELFDKSYSKGVKNKNKEEEEDDSDQLINAHAKGKVDAFAGIKVEAGLKAILQWNAEKIVNHKCKELGDVGVAVNGSVGIGLTGEFKIGYDPTSGRFTIKASASATLAAGYGMTAEFSVGLEGLFELVKYIYNQLKKNDFNFVDLFETTKDGNNVYMIFVAWQVKMLQEEVDLAVDAIHAVKGMATEITIKAQMILSDLKNLIHVWHQENSQEKFIVNILKSIKNNNGIIPFLVPEVKGRILYYLVKHHISYFDDLVHWDINYKSEDAALKIIENCIVSKRDWQETFEHLAVNAKKDGDMAKPYVEIKNKAKDKTLNEIAQDQLLLSQNEIWLKAHLLNDLEDWERVIKKKNELWEQQ